MRNYKFISGALLVICIMWCLVDMYKLSHVWTPEQSKFIWNMWIAILGLISLNSK